ncbi:hypothetical protein V5P93_003040 [Actinokineospora auranticolor]|uniref:Uncharacterized protein n=1 Tax=Actinokineospora auranticolor TaxID=155976 RepID=A0A2S6H183_9PSEU|nr:hypothetical protein [Actinokineospora auranticolor]PPK71176.1 hypothetical protein CLV40_101365 [Actinokineospora auranticolor]
MSEDFTVNVVVFRLRAPAGAVFASTPTRDDAAIRRAWRSATRHRRVDPTEVVAVHSEWEPSSADKDYLATTFPAAHCTHRFPRPTAEGWDQAFARARHAVAEVVRLRAADRGAELLPLLWSRSAPASAALSRLPHAPLVPGRVAVSLAWLDWAGAPAAPDHVTTDDYDEMGAPPFAELLATAGRNLTQGLRVDTQHSDHGDLLTLTRQPRLAASAVAVEGFHARMARRLADDRLVVGLPTPDYLLIAGARSDWLDLIREEVLTTTPRAADPLLPTVLLVEPTGIRVVAERIG